MAKAVSHDQNFKNLILDRPREALEFFAPEEAPQPEDDVRIVPARQEQLQHRLGDRHRELDVPLLVEWTDGRREAILFALEEETDWRRFSPRRLAHYCLDLAELFETDRVVPVVIFPRAARPPAPLVLGTERRDYLRFEFVACRLADLSAGDWLDSDNFVARVNLPNMRAGGHDRVDVYAAAVRGLLALEADDARRAKYLDFIDIYARLTDNELREYQRRYPGEENAMAGIVTRAREEGIELGREQGLERGLEQGMQQGRIAGERAVLERLLRRRFGTLSAAVAERLTKASAAELEVWADRVLDAESIEEALAPTGPRSRRGNATA